MGRKIPGKKHRGVKDPYKQKRVRERSIKKIANAPPDDIEQEQLPKSVLHIMELRELAKGKAFKRNRRKMKKNPLLSTAMFTIKEEKLPGMTKPDKPIPELTQKPGETEGHFLYRVQLMCNDIITESKYQDYFGVEVKRNKETGQVENVVKKPKDEVDKMIEQERKILAKKNQKKKGIEEKPAKKTWAQKKKERKQKKMKKKLDKKINDFERFKDKVEFGEVVHAPPKLRVKPKNVEVSKERKNLLLKSQLEGKGTKANLSRVEKERNEMQRMSVVKAYRALKEKTNKKFSM